MPKMLTIKFFVHFLSPGDLSISSCGLDEPPHAFNGVAGNGTAEYPYPQIEVEQGLCYRLYDLFWVLVILSSSRWS